MIQIEEPEGLRHSINVANEVLSHSGLNLWVFRVLRGKIRINEKKKQDEILRYSVYARTEKEIELWKLLDDLVSQVQKVDSFLMKEADLHLIPKPLLPVRLIEWFDFDKNLGYRIKPIKFKAISKRIS